MGKVRIVGPLTVARLMCTLLTAARARRYYTEAHALLYVVDASDPLRMDESRDVLRSLLATPDLTGIPLLVLANKQDAPGAVTPHEVQARFGLQTAHASDGSSQPVNVVGATSLSGEVRAAGARCSRARPCV